MKQSQKTTVNDAEIAKFSAMADTWWDESGPFKPLHQLNPVRIAYIRDHLQTVKGKSLLDIGCGGGLLSEPFARLGADVTGIDAAEKNIHIASLHAKKSKLNIHYHHTSAEVLAEEGKQFDAVMAMEIIEHVENPAEFIASCAKLTKPDGLFFLSTLNRTLASYALAIIGAEYVLRWLPKGTHEWKKFFKPSEIAEMMEPHFELLDITGITFNPLTREWQKSKRLDVNYMLVAKRRG